MAGHSSGQITWTATNNVAARVLPSRELPSRKETTDDPRQDPGIAAAFQTAQSMTLDELRAAQAAKPTVDLNELRADLFESDDELDAFLVELRAWRQSPQG